MMLGGIRANTMSADGHRGVEPAGMEYASPEEEVPHGWSRGVPEAALD